MKQIRTIVILGVLIILMALIALGALVGTSPEEADKLSPFSEAGPVTKVATGVAPGLFAVNTDWPEWATDRDRENFHRSVSALQDGNSKKFVSTLMVLQGELEERDHEILELKKLLLTDIAGEVLANSLTPLVFGFFGALCLLLISTILSRIGWNPIDWANQMGGWLFGVAGSWLLRVMLGAVLFVALSVAGIWMRSWPDLLFGLTEFLTWLTILLTLLWMGAVTGIIKSEKPRLESCPTCKGTGRVRPPAENLPPIEVA